MSNATPGRFASDAQQAWYGGAFTAEESTAVHRQRRARKPASRNAPMPPMYVRPYPPYPPGWEDPAWGAPITGRELAVGDVIVHLGRHYPVDRFTPYEGGLAAELGAGARTAHSGDWEMAIGPDRIIRILPRETS
jgi:hypothetical protein